jgi:hypothetical protein
MAGRVAVMTSRSRPSMVVSGTTEPSWISRPITTAKTIASPTITQRMRHE